jgi:hypothetical protein
VRALDARLAKRIVPRTADAGSTNASESHSMIATAEPAFLNARELMRLAGDASTLIALDPHYSIQWVNPAWERFARDNGGAATLQRFAIGTSYLEGIGGPLRDYYRSAFDNALLTGEPFYLDYECSSSDVFRRFHMLALPVGGEGLLVTHSQIVERPHDREGHEALERAYRFPSGMVVQCANCRRVRRSDGSSWDWVPAWVTATPEVTSHGICASCRGYYWGAWKNR